MSKYLCNYYFRQFFRLTMHNVAKLGLLKFKTTMLGRLWLYADYVMNEVIVYNIYMCCFYLLQTKTPYGLMDGRVCFHIFFSKMFVSRHHRINQVN